MQTITGVGTSPEWQRSPAKNEPFTAKKNTNVPAYAKFIASKNLTFPTTVKVWDGKSSGQPSATWQNWPSAEVEMIRVAPNYVHIGFEGYNWKYSIDGGSNWVECGYSSHAGYITWDAYKCPANDFTKDKIRKSIEKADTLQNNHTEDQLATNICKNVNGGCTSSCVCNNTSFDYHFRGAMGEHSGGMCCCRALGMITVLQVLGLTYSMAYDNELAPPNTARLIPPLTDCFQCGKRCIRGAWGGGIFNNWQGVAYRGDVSTVNHYSPQGYHISPYATMAHAPNYPNSQAFDHIHAFEYYAWRTMVWDPTTNQYVCDGGFCTHLPKP